MKTAEIKVVGILSIGLAALLAGCACPSCGKTASPVGERVADTVKAPDKGSSYEPSKGWGHRWPYWPYGTNYEGVGF